MLLHHQLDTKRSEKGRKHAASEAEDCLETLTPNTRSYRIRCDCQFGVRAYGGAEDTCTPQRPDSEKLRLAVAFFLSENPNLEPFEYTNGELHRVRGGLWDDPNAAIAAQPDCCRIAYEDAETSKAPELKRHLAENFGGFAYITFEYLADDVSLNPVRSFRSYALDSCGNPVVKMSGE